MDAGSLAFGGSLLVAVPVALLAGLVSFASPCVLPLVPGYIGYVGGMSAASTGVSAASGDGASSPGSGTTTVLARGRKSSAATTGRGRVLAGVALFVGGFTTVFVVLMALTGAVGSFLVRWEDMLLRVLGVVVILMGLAFLGRVPWLQREARLHVAPRAGLWGAPILGFTFGLGWTPCMGPTLAAVQALALDEASVGRGALLGVAYSVGLGIPFLLVALGATTSSPILGFLRAHRLAVMRAGGGLLIAIGLAMVTGVWGAMMSSLQVWIGGFEMVL